MNRLSGYVGKTPLIPIEFGGLTVWGKCEFMNPGGSVKDRMAKFIIDNAESAGLIKKGDTLCEATSGNTGIAFAMLAAERGYNMKIVMPSNMSQERKHLCKAKSWFNCNQFHNSLNIQAHYMHTGPEICNQYPTDIDTPAAFVLGTGTGGTLMGAGSRIKQLFTSMKIVAVEPEESAVMSGFQPSLHGIQGIGDGSKFLVDLDFVDEIKTVHTECAKKVARHLALRYGLFVGISAGANVKATFEWLRDNDKKHAITILCDRGERYLSCL
jgi:cysteine synthase A